MIFLIESVIVVAIIGAGAYIVFKFKSRSNSQQNEQYKRIPFVSEMRYTLLSWLCTNSLNCRDL
jgi:flagellar basal body-associated protein FliL